MHINWSLSKIIVFRKLRGREYQSKVALTTHVTRSHKAKLNQFMNNLCQRYVVRVRMISLAPIVTSLAPPKWALWNIFKLIYVANDYFPLSDLNGGGVCCSSCKFMTHLKQRMKCHVEAKYVNTGGVMCTFCQYICPFRKALQAHNSGHHKLWSM